MTTYAKFDCKKYRLPILSVVWYRNGYSYTTYTYTTKYKFWLRMLNLNHSRGLSDKTVFLQNYVHLTAINEIWSIDVVFFLSTWQIKTIYLKDDISILEFSKKCSKMIVIPFGPVVFIFQASMLFDFWIKKTLPIVGIWTRGWDSCKAAPLITRLFRRHKNNWDLNRCY